MIILTGASGGIGQDLIEHLSNIDDVVGVYNKTVPESILGKKITYEHLDIENLKDIETFAKKWGQKSSNITIVSAAGLKIDGLAASYSKEDWDKVMNVNLKGSFFFIKAFLPFMIESKWGRIVHFSSTGGLDGSYGTITYSISKSGLLGMSRVLAKEYARFNVTSNVLVLGHFKSGMYDALSDEVKKELLDQVPSKALGDISNISNAIDFLIKSQYVTGTTINIDGGI